MNRHRHLRARVGARNSRPWYVNLSVKDSLSESDNTDCYRIALYFFYTGAINSWDRQPYQQIDGGFVPALTVWRENFIINSYYGIHRLVFFSIKPALHTL